MQNTYLPALCEKTTLAEKRKAKRMAIRNQWGDMTLAGIFEKIILDSPSMIILVSDFYKFGGKDQIARTLRILRNEGRIFRLFHQAYVRGIKNGSLWIPESRNIEALAREAFTRLGYTGYSQIMGNRAILWEAHKGGKRMFVKFDRKVLLAPDASVADGAVRMRNLHDPRGKRPRRRKNG